MALRYGLGKLRFELWDGLLQLGFVDVAYFGLEVKTEEAAREREKHKVETAGEWPGGDGGWARDGHLELEYGWI